MKEQRSAAVANKKEAARLLKEARDEADGLMDIMADERQAELL